MRRRLRTALWLIPTLLSSCLSLAGEGAACGDGVECESALRCCAGTCVAGASCDVGDAIDEGSECSLDGHECGDGCLDGGQQCETRFPLPCVPVNEACPNGGSSCEARRVCLDALGEVDGLDGGEPCTEDAECYGGLCGGVGAVRICVGLCASTADCVAGRECEEREVFPGRTTWLCVVPEAVPCREDSDCTATGGRCRLQEPLQVESGGAFASCVDDVPSAEFGTICDVPGVVADDDWGPGDCPVAQVCVSVCDENAATVCDPGFCSRLCVSDDDCPFRYACRVPDKWRFGEGEPLKSCQLVTEGDVEWGCWDDSDCCAVPSASGAWEVAHDAAAEDPARPDRFECCVRENGDTLGVCAGDSFRTHCGARVYPGQGPAHVQSQCRPQDPIVARGWPGDACTVPQDCTTGVCAPDGAGGGLCVQLCQLPQAADPAVQRFHPLLADPCDPTGLGHGRSCELQVVAVEGFVDGEGGQAERCLPVCGRPGAAPACTDAGTPAP